MAAAKPNWRETTPAPTRESPGRQREAVTPDDNKVYDPPIRFFWVGTPGDLVLEDLAGDVTTIPSAYGTVWSSARRVLAATTAAGIVGEY